jgi:hypothetical protein
LRRDSASGPLLSTLTVSQSILPGAHHDLSWTWEDIPPLTEDVLLIHAIADESDLVDEYDEANNHNVALLRSCPDSDGDHHAIRIGSCILRSGDQTGDCDDTNPNCTIDCTDADGDTHCVTTDCREDDPDIYPDAPELNDGLDNQCPGDVGYGVVDETSGESGFHNPEDKTEYSWPAQVGATLYEVARSSVPDFSANCVVMQVAETYWLDDEPLPVGNCFYYLNRPAAPLAGSWGQGSSGAERTNICP